MKITLKTIILIFTLIILNGCTKTETISCSKTDKNENFDYNVKIEMTLINEEITSFKSEANYILTEKGKELKENLKTMLENKKDFYVLEDNIKIDYSVTEDRVTIKEEIIYPKDEDYSDATDLSISYINFKTNKKDILESLKYNGLYCE